MTHDLDEYRRAACDVAREAGALARSWFERQAELTVEKKGVQDLVSQADREVEDLVVARLKARFPNAAVLGEERGGPAPSAELLWVVDPIDGTLNFVRGIAHWCVSLALVVDGEAAVGVVFDPVAGELFEAHAGGGALLNGHPIAPSTTARLDEAVVCYGESRRVAPAIPAAVVQALRSRDVELRKLGSGALDTTWVGCGRFDAYFEAHLNPWDALAALCIVRAAGGRTNDFLDGDGLAKGNKLLASNAALYDELSRHC